MVYHYRAINIAGDDIGAHINLKQVQAISAPSGRTGQFEVYLDRRANPLVLYVIHRDAYDKLIAAWKEACK